MTSRATVVATSLVLVAAAGGAVAWARHDLDATQHVPARVTAERAPVIAGQTVRVESGAPSTSFLPLGSGPDDGRTLSAQRAYNAMLQGLSRSTPIPAGVRAYYGVLTHRFNSASATHVRVWGFAVESGCVSTADVATSAAARCRTWEFVNARTGHDLGLITQEMLPD